MITSVVSKIYNFLQAKDIYNLSTVDKRAQHEFQNPYSNDIQLRMIKTKYAKYINFTIDIKKYVLDLKYSDVVEILNTSMLYKISKVYNPIIDSFTVPIQKVFLDACHYNNLEVVEKIYYYPFVNYRLLNIDAINKCIEHNRINIFKLITNRENHNLIDYLSDPNIYHYKRFQLFKYIYESVIKTSDIDLGVLKSIHYYANFYSSNEIILYLFSTKHFKNYTDSNVNWVYLTCRYNNQLIISKLISLHKNNQLFWDHLTSFNLLRLVVKNRYHGILNLILSNYKINQTTSDCIMSHAMDSNNFKTISLLFKYGYFQNESFTERLIKKSILCNQSHILEKILNSFDVNVVFGEKIINHIINKGSYDIIKILIIDHRTHHFFKTIKAFKKICKHGFIDIAIYLVDILKEFLSSFEFPYVVMIGKLYLVQSIAQNKFILRRHVNCGMHVASNLGNLKILQYLFENKPNDIIDQHKIALSKAIEKNHSHIIKYLIDDVKIKIKNITFYIKKAISLNNFYALKTLSKLINKNEIDQTLILSLINTEHDNEYTDLKDFQEMKLIVSFLLNEMSLDPTIQNNLLLYGSYSHSQKLFNIIIENDRVDPFDDLHNTFMAACVENNNKMIEKIIDVSRNKPNFQILDDNILYAISIGHQKASIFLYPFIKNPFSSNNFLLKRSIEYGCDELFNIMLQDNRANFSIDNNYPIRYASLNGHYQIVKSLLTLDNVDPSDQNNFALRHASENGHYEIVKLLLTDCRVNPNTDGNDILLLAIENGHLECVKLLLNDQRININNNTLSILKEAVLTGNIKITRILLSYRQVLKKITHLPEIIKLVNRIYQNNLTS